MPIDVLLVDGDERFLADMEEAFRGAGVSVVATSDGDEAFSLAEQTPPSLVILTVEARPGKPSGFTLCRKFRQADQFAKVPIFILGAAVTEEVFEQHKRHKYPANEYFSKPIQASELVMSAAQYVAIGENTDHDPFDISMADGLDLDSLLSLDELGDLDLDGDDLELSLSSAIDSSPVPEAQGAVTVFPGQPSADDVAAVASADRGAALRPSSNATPFEQAGPTDQHDVVSGADGAAVVSSEVLEELTTLRNQLIESQAEAAESRTKSSVAARELEQAKASSESLRERVAALEAQLAESASSATSSTAREMLTLRTQLNRAEGEMLGLKDEIFAREHKILELEERIEQRSSEFSELKTSLSDTENKASSLEEKVRELIATIDKRDTEIAERSSELDSLRSDLARSSSELAELRAEIQASRDSWTAESDTLQFRLAEVVESERLARSEIEQLVVVHDEKLRAAQTAFETRQAELEAEIAAAKSALETATESATASLAELEATTTQLRGVESELKEANETAGLVSGERDALNERVESLSRNLRETQERATTAESNIEDQRARIEALQADLDAVTAARNEAVERASESESVVATLRDELTAAAAKTSQLENDVKEALELADVVQGQLTSRVAEAAELQGQLASAGSDLEASRHRAQLAQEEAAELRTRLEAVSEEVDALRAARDELGEQLSVLQHEHIAISTLAEEAQKARETAETQLRESADENEAFRGRISELAESSERANEKIAALRNALGAYERAHTASQDAIAGLQTEVEALREQNRALLEERRASGTYLEHLSQALTAVTLLLERRPSRGSFDSIESVATGALAALELALDDLRIARVQTGPHPAADDGDAPSHTPVPVSMPSATTESSENASAAPDDAESSDQEFAAELAMSEPMFSLDDAEFVELESDLVDLEDL